MIIRRPLFYSAISFCLAILICFFSGKLIAFCVLAFLLVLYLRNLNNKIIMLILIFYVISVFNFFIYDLGSGKFDDYIGSNVEISGEIKNFKEKKNSQGDKYIQLELCADRLNGSNISDNLLHRPHTVLVNCYNEKFLHRKIVPGYEVSVKGRLDEPKKKSNPNCFDYALYLKSIGIEVLLNADDIEVLDYKSTLQGNLYNLKKIYKERLKETSGKEISGFMSGIMFGEKEDIDEEILEDFQKNGTAHILAVSGLHVGIIYGFISILWRGRKKKIFFAFITLFMMCYVILASFSPSVIRAVFMVELHALSKLLHRRYDLSSAAFLAVVFILYENPMMIFNAGFQMSFIAVLSMAAVIPYIKRVYDGMFTAGIAVQAGLLPYTMYSFNYFSLASLFVNIPIIFLAGIVVPLGLCVLFLVIISEGIFSLSSLLSSAPEFMIEIISKFIAGICVMIKFLNEMTCIDGITVFEVTSPGHIFLAFYYLSMLAFMSEAGRLLIIRKGRSAIKILVLIITAFSLSFGYVTKSGFEKADIVFVDVGQGDCIHIKTENGSNYFVDGGGNVNYDLGRKTLKPYLLKNGVKELDGAFVTHLHTDHYKGIAELCRQGMIRKLFLYEGNCVNEDKILKETGLERDNLVYISEGQNILLSREANIEVLAPEKRTNDEYLKLAENSKDENEMSLIMKVNIGNKSVLVTGDIDEKMEDELSEKYGDILNSDILKVAHHGSKYSYSEKFAEFVSAKYAVFQVGKNNYGHPNEAVLVNYRNLGAEVFRNDIDGAVGFIMNYGKDAMEVVTALP